MSHKVLVYFIGNFCSSFLQNGCNCCRKTKTEGKQESVQFYVPLLELDHSFEVKGLPQFF
jgi:hypothetical protein